MHVDQELYDVDLELNNLDLGEYIPSLPLNIKISSPHSYHYRNTHAVATVPIFQQASQSPRERHFPTS